MMNPSLPPPIPTRDYDADLPPPVPTRDYEAAPPVPPRDYDAAPPVPERDYDAAPPIPERDYDAAPPIPPRDYDAAPPIPERDYDAAPPIPLRDYNAPPPPRDVARLKLRSFDSGDDSGPRRPARRPRCPRGPPTRPGRRSRAIAVPESDDERMARLRSAALSPQTPKTPETPMESPHPQARHFEPTAAELFAQAARRRRPGKAGDQARRDRLRPRRARRLRPEPRLRLRGPFVARAATRAEAPAHFSRALTVRTGAKSFVAVAEDARERDAWLASIAGAAGADMDAESDALAPVWVEDKNADACGLCDAKFTMFFRRHHCRKCGRLVCAGAATASPGTEDRACDDCAKATK
ncbi:hypothetical protein JL721_4199 [Aureococcus anophagefferens]|nr:hypothetical protein JL721_4199 [Aureococcus anophagefferens]